MNKISLCITTFNRFAYLFKSFEQVIDDDRIGEVIIVDDHSDNVIDIDYLNKIYRCEWNPKTILAPDFARPHFDYRQYSGVTFRKDNVSKYTFRGQFPCLINTMNYFVHRDSYLSVWKPKEGIKGADSIYMNYLWLMAGNEIHCLKGLQYFHRLEFEKGEHGSNYNHFAKDSAPQCDKIEKQLSLLR